MEQITYREKLQVMTTEELLTETAEKEAEKTAIMQQRDKLTDQLYRLTKDSADAVAHVERRRMELLGSAMWHFFLERGKTQELQAIAIRHVIDVLNPGEETANLPHGDLALLGLPNYSPDADQDHNKLKKLKTLLQLGMTPPPIPSEVEKQKRLDQFNEIFPDLESMLLGEFDDDDDDDEDTL